MEIHEALQEYFKRKNISQVSIAEALNVSKAYVNALLSGRQRFGKKQAEIWSEKFGLSKSWLLTGEGDMLKKQEMYNEVEDVMPEERELIERGLQDGTFRLVPLINIDSVGGIHSGNLIDPSEQYVIRSIPFAEARTGDVAILQSGNSMYPTIPSGSILLIREVVDWREYFGYGGIYVLWLRDGRRITKEIRRYDADPQNYVWCVSYNPDVADEELPKSLIVGVWKVVKYLADFGW